MNSKQNIFIKNIYGWRKIQKLNNTLWIKGIIYNSSDNDIFKRLILIKEKKINKFFKELDGHFAIIFKQNNRIICSVDEISSIPIFYFKDKTNFFVTPFPDLAKDKFNKILIKEQTLSLAMSSYTLGEQSIYKNFYRLKGGSFLIFNKNKLILKKFNYHTYEAWKMNNKNSYSDIKKKLNNLNLKIIQKLYRFSLRNKKKIAVPLSAGYDSRLILSILKEIGAKNVFCYSYGLKKNFEAQAAKKLAKKLGYDWYFVELNNSKIYKSYRSKNFLNFFKIFNTFSSSSDMTEFFVIEELHKKKILKNSIIVNGNSGDFISGGHILEYSNKGSDSQKIINNLVQAFIKKHFRLWDYLAKKDNDRIISGLLINEIKNLKIYKNINKNNSHSIIEYLEFYNRQSKHVCSRQRIYEYFNYEWALPLWDKEYIDFWKKIQMEYKLKQRLYEDVLITENYGNVWSGKKWINLRKSLKTTPIIFRFIIRPLAKCFFVFGKKSSWHNFERRYILYFTDVLCGMGVKKYKDVALDKRGFRNFLSLHTENYLKKYKIKLFDQYLTRKLEE